MATPAIVVVSQYVTAEKANELNRSFEGFVEYVDRDDAKKSQQFKNDLNIEELSAEDLYYMYLRYMGDEEKRGELFSKDADVLDDDRFRKMKGAFSLAQKNQSPMWQDVISFDNAWLEKQEMYNSITGELDETKMKNVVREAVGGMLKAEKMEESAIWTAAIHYNTKNIHVHVATVEPFPTREKRWFYYKETKEWKEEYRAKRKQKSLDQIKSITANLILDRKEQREKVDAIIKDVPKQKREGKLDLSAYRKTKKLFVKALMNLPADRRQWYYGYQTINEARPYIDEIVEVYLDTFHKDEMQELETLLDEDVEIMKELYGEGSQAEEYKINKLYEGKESLRYKMANAVLAEMRAYAKNKDTSFTKGRNNSPPISEKWQRKGELFQAMRHLNFRLRKTFHDYRKERNIDEFDRMLEGYEQ